MLNIRLLLIFIIATAAPAYAGVYKWVDEQGKVHFSDRPASAQARQLKLKKSPQQSTSAVPNAAQRQITQQRMLDMYQQEREKREAARKKKKADAKKLAQRCANARDRLRRYEGSRLYENLPNGERRYFSEAEREKTISNLKGNIKRYCK